MLDIKSLLPKVMVLRGGGFVLKVNVMQRSNMEASQVTCDCGWTVLDEIPSSWKSFTIEQMHRNRGEQKNLECAPSM